MSILFYYLFCFFFFLSLSTRFLTLTKKFLLFDFFLLFFFFWNVALIAEFERVWFLFWQMLNTVCEIEHERKVKRATMNCTEKLVHTHQYRVNACVIFPTWKHEIRFDLVDFDGLPDSIHHSEYLNFFLSSKRIWCTILLAQLGKNEFLFFFHFLAQNDFNFSFVTALDAIRMEIGKIAISKLTYAKRNDVLFYVIPTIVFV